MAESRRSRRGGDEEPRRSSRRVAAQSNAKPKAKEEDRGRRRSQRRPTAKSDSQVEQKTESTQPKKMESQAAESLNAAPQKRPQSLRAAAQAAAQKSGRQQVPSAEQLQSAQDKAQVEKQKAIAKQQALAKQKAAAEKKALAEKNAIAEKRALAEKKALAEQKALAKQKALVEQKAIAEKNAIAEKKALAKQKAIAQQQALKQKQKAVAESESQETVKPKSRTSGRAQKKPQTKPQAKSQSKPQPKSSSKSSAKRASAVSQRGSADPASAVKGGRKSARTSSVTAASGRSSKRQSAVATAPRSSGRMSSRMETQPSSKMPFILGGIVVIALVAGAVFMPGGETLRLELNILIKKYEDAHSSMKSAVKNKSPDKAEKYYKIADAAIVDVRAFVKLHIQDIEYRPDTDAQKKAIEDLHNKIPLISKKLAVKKAGSLLQSRVNQINRIHDLDRLQSDVDKFLANPLPSDTALSDSEKKELLKEVTFLRDTNKAISTEKERRLRVFELPALKADNRNDLQKREERIDYGSFTKNIVGVIEKNKFGAAYTTALLFNKKFPSCPITDEWQKIEVKEKEFWKTCEAQCRTKISGGSQAQLASAQSALRTFIDANGKEEFLSSARKMLDSCDQKIAGLAAK